jgi:hypothetical protein
MGFPAKLLAEGERPLVVLRPHVHRLARPALVLVVLAPVAAYAVAAVPRGAAQAPARLVVAALAALVAVRWVVLPFVLWWNTLYVLTDQRVFERQGLVRRSGHDLPLRGVTDVLVAQRLGDRLLRCGTLTVTTGGGRELVLADVPAVARLQRNLLAVADHLAAQARDADEERWRFGADDLDLDAGAGEELARDVDEELSGDWDGAGWDLVDREDDREDHRDDHADGEPLGGPSRRDARRRHRESTRRLKALQAEVRRAPRADSPLEDDGVESAQTPPSGAFRSSAPAPDAAARTDGDSAASVGVESVGRADSAEAEEARAAEGARILRFPRRP